MKIIGINKPVYRLYSNFNKKETKQLTDIFTQNNSRYCIVLDSYKNASEKLESRIINTLSENESCLYLEVLPFIQDFFARNINLKKTTSIRKASVIIMGNPPTKVIDYVYSNFYYVEGPDIIYDLTDTDHYMGVTPKTAFNLLKKAGLFDDSYEYKVVSNKNYSYIKNIGNDLFIEEFYNSNIPIILEKDLFDTMANSREVLSIEELHSVDELLSSPEKNNIILGLMLLGTSNYNKIFYTIKGIIYKNGWNIRRRVSSSELSKIIPGFYEKACRDMISRASEKISLSDLYPIFNNNKGTISKEDADTFKIYFKETFDDILDTLVSKRAKKSLELLGLSFNAQLI